MITSKTILNTDVYETEDENLQVDFTFETDKNGRCESTAINNISYYVPALDNWISTEAWNNKLYSIADKLIERWIEKNHYNETLEFRINLDKENNCKD